VKLNPTQKSRIIRLLKSKGMILGFLGDGINDALALHQADIGFSVDNATEIAKETSDIILLKSDLRILNEIIMEGRKTSINILKYMKMTLASQLGDILSLLMALL